RWGDHFEGTLHTRDQDWQPAVTNVLRNFLSYRYGVVIQQLRGAGLFPSYEAPEFSQWGGAVPPGYMLTISNRYASGTVYYTLDGSDPRRVGGALSPTAIAYDGPIPLHGATTVRARLLLSSRWTAIVEADFYLQQDLSNLQLSELMYNPPKVGAVDGDEFE